MSKEGEVIVEAFMQGAKKIDMLRKENAKFREALTIIAAQDSRVVGSTEKSDCMASIAELALRDRQ